MEMTSHMPFPKTQATQPGKPKNQKSRHEENAGAEIASFPTILQESHKTLQAGQKKEPEKSVEEKPAAQPVPAVAMGDVENPAGMGIGVAEPVIESKPVTASSVEAPTIPTVELTTAPVLSEKPQLSGEVIGETVETEVSSESATVENSKIESAVDSAPENPGLLNETSLQVEGVTNSPENNLLQPEATVVQVENKHETNTTEEKTSQPVQSVKAPEVASDDKQLKATVEELGDDQEQPEISSDAASLKVEVVEETSESEESPAPVVENPAMARQSSAELDMLAAKANAEKVYQNPNISAENSHSTKTTLAALDLDSGSMESEEQKESHITRILSSLKDTSSPIKRSIHNQVLNRVVEHLQEEMSTEKLTIRLNPEKLGQVEIMFQATGDQLEITMSSSGKDAEQALQEGTRELAEKISDNSVRYNLVEIKVENRGQDQQTKQDSRQEEKRERQGNGQDKQQHEGQQSQTNHHNHETGAGEWAAFHLGG